MNILFLANHLNIGGITSYILSLSKGLKKRRHNIYIASSGGVLLSKFIEEGITHIAIPIKTKQEVSPKILLSMLRLSGEIKKHGIELVHSHSRTTQVLGCLLNKALGVPYLSTCHGFFKQRFFRKIFPCWGQKIIAISEPVKEHLVKDFRVDEKRIAVIHNGIDTGYFSRPSTVDHIQIKVKLGLGSGPVVGIVARLSDVKGHIYLIRAMKAVLEKIPGAELLIVGEGKIKEQLVKAAGNLGIQKNVIFMAQVNDTKEVLSVMDVFVMPSLKEGLGLALMEAMALGLPVIGSAVGGIKSLIQNDYNGILVKPTDTVELSKAILGLLQNPDRAKSLGEKAMMFIQENFSQKKMVLHTERMYLECVNAAG